MARTAADPSPTLMWFRRDLRLSDNPALQAAAQAGGAVVPVFIVADPNAPRPLGAASLWWLDKSLAALAERLEALGSRLILRRGPPAEVLEGLVEETGARRVVWGRTYEPAADAEDEALVSRLGARGVEARAHEGRLLVEPGAVTTKEGKPYAVFSPFWRAVQAAVHPSAPLAAPERLAAPRRWPASEPLSGFGLHPSKPDWSGGFADWRPGEAAAQRRLDAFLDERIAAYPTDRDRPAVDGSSRLSPHLAWGEISPRQVHCAARARLAAHGLEHAVDKFLSELAWRDFDYGLLAQDPELHRIPFKPAAAIPKWRRSRAEFEAWTRGLTGYPIVDAGMRQLWRLGWMHNRVRLITSSFLVKHLLMDWREGEAWFWDCLVDADPANNPANWQWIAGTGADAQPFFRIFNPLLQGAKFDAGGDYVRQWVPELAKLSARWVHTPWLAPAGVLEAAGIRLGVDYPKPIVEHEAARARALAALAEARSLRPSPSGASQG